MDRYKIPDLDWTKFGIKPTKDEMENDLKHILNSPLRTDLTEDNFKHNLNEVLKMIKDWCEISNFESKNMLELIEAFCIGYRYEDKVIKLYQDTLAKG